ncbi:hypothetical protein ACFL08_00755 [Patescibacteria group bacterium]
MGKGESLTKLIEGMPDLTEDKIISEINEGGLGGVQKVIVLENMMSMERVSPFRVMSDFMPLVEEFPSLMEKVIETKKLSAPELFKLFDVCKYKEDTIKDILNAKTMSPEENLEFLMYIKAYKSLSEYGNDSILPRVINVIAWSDMDPVQMMDIFAGCRDVDVAIAIIKTDKMDDSDMLFLSRACKDERVYEAVSEVKRKGRINDAKSGNTSPEKMAEVLSLVYAKCDKDTIEAVEEILARA